MSRIGKKPIVIPSNVKISLDGNVVNVDGPKGKRSFSASDEVNLTLSEDSVSVLPRGNSKRARQMWGMTRTQIDNLVAGVTNGFMKKLEIQGVGYRAQVQGSVLKLSLGYSHDVDFKIPEGIDIKTPKPTEIEITGIDQQQVGQVAAKIRDWRRPEPYKGKGIRYQGEQIFRKEGKKK